MSFDDLLWARWASGALKAAIKVLSGVLGFGGVILSVPLETRRMPYRTIRRRHPHCDRGLLLSFVELWGEKIQKHQPEALRSMFLSCQVPFRQPRGVAGNQGGAAACTDAESR